jgi:hypothetical protein
LRGFGRIGRSHERDVRNLLRSDTLTLEANPLCGLLLVQLQPVESKPGAELAVLPHSRQPVYPRLEDCRDKGGRNR